MEGKGMDTQALDRLLSDMNSRNITFILGAGTSMGSGICKGSTLAYGWMKHLINMAGNPPGDPFLKLKQQIDDGLLADINYHKLAELFDNDELYAILTSDFESKCTWKMIVKILLWGVEKNYFRIASYLTSQQPGLLQASILEAMQGKIASSGYFRLAKMMQECSTYSSKNIVITTNFDDLLLQALYKNFETGHRTPIVISHRALAHQIQLIDISKNPIIFKVHHDFLFEPLNTEYDVMHYTEDVKKALGRLISNRVLLVLGYSGANDNLMDYLIHYNEQLTVYWGYYDNLPNSDKFNELSASHHHVIPFCSGDFDTFMDSIFSQLQTSLGNSKSSEQPPKIFSDKRSVSFSAASNIEDPIQKKTARDELGLTRF